VTLATQEAAIRRIAVQSQPQKSCTRDLISKKPCTKRADGVAQGVGFECKPQYYTHTHTNPYSGELCSNKKAMPPV
jgi:hypothetical protein